MTLTALGRAASPALLWLHTATRCKCWWRIKKKKKKKVYSLTPLWHYEAQSCSTGILNSPNHWFTSLCISLFPFQVLLLYHPYSLSNKQHISVYPLPTVHGLADFITLFGVYDLIALVISSLFSSSAKLLLSFVIYNFLLCLTLLPC